MESPGKMVKKPSEKDSFLSFLTSKISSNDEEETESPKLKPSTKNAKNMNDKR